MNFLKRIMFVGALFSCIGHAQAVSEKKEGDAKRKVTADEKKRNLDQYFQKFLEQLKNIETLSDSAFERFYYQYCSPKFFLAQHKPVTHNQALSVFSSYLDEKLKLLIQAQSHLGGNKPLTQTAVMTLAGARLHLLSLVSVRILKQLALDFLGVLEPEFRARVIKQLLSIQKQSFGKISSMTELKLSVLPFFEKAQGVLHAAFERAEKSKN